MKLLPGRSDIMNFRDSERLSIHAGLPERLSGRHPGLDAGPMSQPLELRTGPGSIEMMRMPRYTIFLAVIGLMLVGILPPWKICWTASGTVCACPDGVPCQGEEPWDTGGSPGSACTDLLAFEAQKVEDVPAGLIEVLPPVLLSVPATGMVDPSSCPQSSASPSPELAPLCSQTRPLLC